MMPPDIGLTERVRTTSIASLNVINANLFVLRMKTKRAHWNVVGPHFTTLHALLDEHATALDAHLDEGAERVRMLGDEPLATTRGFLGLASLREDEPHVFSHALALVEQLCTDHESVVRDVRVASSRVDHLDVGTLDFFTRLLQWLEKSSWMLRAWLETGAPRGLRSAHRWQDGAEGRDAVG